MAFYRKIKPLVVFKWPSGQLLQLFIGKSQSLVDWQRTASHYVTSRKPGNDISKLSRKKIDQKSKTEKVFEVRVGLSLNKETVVSRLSVPLERR